MSGAVQREVGHGLAALERGDVRAARLHLERVKSRCGTDLPPEAVGLIDGLGLKTGGAVRLEPEPPVKKAPAKKRPAKKTSAAKK